jgi:hypothetical protein
VLVLRSICICSDYNVLSQSELSLRQKKSLRCFNATLSQNYSSRDITKKNLRSITNVLTTLDGIFAIKTYVNEVVLV